MRNQEWFRYCTATGFLALASGCGFAAPSEGAFSNEEMVQVDSLLQEMIAARAAGDMSRFKKVFATEDTVTRHLSCHPMEWGSPAERDAVVENRFAPTEKDVEKWYDRLDTAFRMLSRDWNSPERTVKFAGIDADVSEPDKYSLRKGERFKGCEVVSDFAAMKATFYVRVDKAEGGQVVSSLELPLKFYLFRLDGDWSVVAWMWN